ncbi:unnamed protein product [Trichobilharzia regenti]|uniref:BHLH domain-containing protein n=1 Tax=Trichobilharzia regenti TaxID=157069 RepID=A0A183WLR6_TRIRE|nr:unnamed protein product [Trichobilharzia regenti]VDQ08949.1 unnamed protein product [Trichobilharzia regenti]
MSSNCVKNLPPFQRISSIKRKRNQTINSLKGLRKHTRDRVHLKTSQNNRHLKPHQIECERLKEILPTVANCEKLDEVKIIQEAIKHINHLEQAVLQRLNIVNTQTTIENSISNSSSLLPAFIFKLLSSRNNLSQSTPEKNQPMHTPHTDPNYKDQFIRNNSDIGYQHNKNTLSNMYDVLNSSGSTPYQTDEDIDQMN